MQIRYTTDGNTYIIANIDGMEVRCEAPGELSEAQAQAYIDANEDMLVCDYYMRTYMESMDVPTPEEGESQREAWERVLAE